MKGVQRFRNLNLERQPGELARLRVLGGPDNGLVFIIVARQVTLGRGEENDVVLTDMKMSRRHAEIAMSETGVVIRDLGSANGFLLNGAPQKQATLRSGDKIGLGATVLEFVGAEAATTLLMPSRAPVKEVGTGASGLTRFIQKEKVESDSIGLLGALFTEKRAPAVPGAQQTFMEKNRKAIFILGALFVLATMVPKVEQKQRARNQYLEPKEIEGERSIGSLKPPQADEGMRKSSDIYVQEGLRELRAKNYARARVDFETALQVYADHPLAHIYLETTDKEMEKEARAILSEGKKNEEASRYAEARKSYDSVRRLYLKDQSSPLYKEADARIQDLDKKTAMDKAEELKR